MLYVIERKNTDYQGGQDDIVHLELEISEVLKSGRPWLFTNMHAELGLADFYDDIEKLDQHPRSISRR